MTPTYLVVLLNRLLAPHHPGEARVRLGALPARTVAALVVHLLLLVVTGVGGRRGGDEELLVVGVQVICWGPSMMVCTHASKHGGRAGMYACECA